MNFMINKLHKLEDALRETGETGDTEGKWDTGLIWSTVLRHYLTEIRPKMGKIIITKSRKTAETETGETRVAGETEEVFKKFENTF